MSINMKTAIANMRSLKAKGITYSMSGSRTGADGTGDCSGTVYASLNKAGAKLAVGNTDTMFRDLPKVGFKKVTGAHKYGDIFVWGRQGASSGAAGHTGIFLDGKTMINCNYAYNGVVINDYSTIWKAAGRPPETFFRLDGQDGGNNSGNSGGSGSSDASISKNNKENMDNSGEIEEYSYIKDQLCIKGWHFASNATKESSGGVNGEVGDNTNEGSNGGAGGNSGETFKVNWSSMQSRAQFFIYVCMDLGYPKNTALALLANANTESSIDPSALEPRGNSVGGAQGHGYLQWSFSSNWGKVPQHMKRTYADAKYQLKWAKDFKGQWRNVGYGSFNDFWKGNKSPEYLTNAWVASWERPAQIGNRWAQLNNTINVSKLKFEKMKSASPAKATTVSTASLAVPAQPYASENKSEKEGVFATEIMEIFDATNDALLKSIPVELKERTDIKKDNPDVQGVEWSGIDFCMKFEHKNPFYVKFTRILPDGSKKQLNLTEIFYPHSSSRSDIGHDYCQEDGIAILATDKNKRTEIITELLSGISFSHRANEVPSCSFTIPITEVDKLDGNMDIKFIIAGTMFDGIVKKIDLDKAREVANITVDHKISEWEDRQIPKNVTVKNRVFPDVFSMSPFLYSTDWYIDCDKEAQKAKIDYAFSRQNHLEALTKACSLTDNIFWRVGTRFDRYLEIGAFGEKKPYIFTEPTRNMTDAHLPILGAVSIERDFDSVFNVLTVYGEKSDSSQASLTLRDAYLDQQRKGKPLIEGFPIVVLNPTVNNEQKNYYTNITKIASNNSLEYAILDEFGINLEQGKLIEQTASFNDVAPFEQNNESISDEERAKQSMIAYQAGVRRLKYSGRRREVIKFDTGCLPCDLNVLDRVYFDYSNQLQLFDRCSRYCKKIYEASDYFYIESIDTNFDENFMETNSITLVKELKQHGDTY